MGQFNHHGATVLPETSENCPQTAGRVISSPKALGELSTLCGGPYATLVESLLLEKLNE